jgi:2-oxoglutarate dehydrogenase E1 component
MDSFSFVGNSDIEAIEKLYQDYKNDPDSVDAGMRDFFRGFDFAQKQFEESAPGLVNKEFNVINLIHGYRQRGHLFTSGCLKRIWIRYFRPETILALVPHL